MQDNDIQKMIEGALKKQEEALRKLYEEREQNLIEQHQRIEKEWAASFDTKTETIAQGVAEHIGKEVVTEYTVRFGEDSEATQVAKQFPFQEKAQVAVQFLRDDGQIMTADERKAKFTTTWDEFNHMGGLTTEQAHAKTFDPFANEQPVSAPALTQEVKDIMTAIDYQVQNYSQVDNFPVADSSPKQAQEQLSAPAPTVKTPEQVSGAIKGLRGTVEGPAVSDDTTAPIEDVKALRESAKAAFRARPNLDLGKPSKAANQDQDTVQDVTGGTKEAVKNVLAYKTISPTDQRLSFDVLTEEMSAEKFNAFGKAEVLVNYFRKTRHFEFKGKTAEEFRANCIEKKDYVEWAKSFFVTRDKMIEDQASEIKLQPYTATNKETKSLELKHSVEKKFFDLSEKTEMAKAQENFPHAFMNNTNKNPDVANPPTLKERNELKELFQDYAADRLGGSCRTIFEETPRQVKIKKLSSALVAPKQATEQKSTQSIAQRIRQMKFSL